MIEKVTDKPKAPGQAIITRVKFVSPIKLGPSEYSMWTPDRVPAFSCQASPVGLVFRMPDAAYECVVPFTNISSYEVER